MARVGRWAHQAADAAASPARSFTPSRRVDACFLPARSIDLIESDRKAKQPGRRETVLRTALSDRRPPVPARPCMYPCRARVGIDHPKLFHAVARIEPRLEPLVVSKA